MYIDLKRLTRSYILATNKSNVITNKSKGQLKRGRPIDSKEKYHRKKRWANNLDDHIEEAATLEETLDINSKTSKEV